ncbi:MAG TPA: DUF935 family protein [Thermoanaerobaculia bacterium]|jgi:phage gp29-like protein|nr:DUF935 family protein [Thermoanaerobaculia bacterium]
MLDALTSETPSRAAAILARYGGEDLASERATSILPSVSSGALFEEWRHPGEAVRANPGKRPGALFTAQKKRSLVLPGLFQKRADAVAALPRSIEPLDGSREAVEVADFVRAALGAITQRATVIAKQTEIFYWGVMPFELFWGRPTSGPLTGKLTVMDVKDRPMDRFAFDRKTGSLHVRRSGVLRPELPPPGKFWTLQWGTRDNPWGEPLADDLFWLCELERVVNRSWCGQLDRFGSPWTIGRYPSRSAGDENESANQRDIAVLLNAMIALRSNKSIALPEHVNLSLLESTLSGGNFGQFLQLLLRGIAICVLGEVDTSGLAEGPGSFAKLLVTNDVRFEKVARDAHFGQTAENDTLIEWLVHLNYGPDAPRPRSIWRIEELQDRKTRQEGVTGALAIGLPVAEHQARLAFGVPSPRPGEAVIEPRAAAEPAPPPTPALSSRGGRIALAASESVPDFDAIAEERLAALDEVADAFLPATFAHTGQLQAEIGRLFGEGRVADGTALSQLVARLDFVGPAEAFQAALVHSCGLALRSLRDDGGEGLLSLASGVPFAQATTPQAAVTFWERLLGLSKDLFSELLPRLRRLAFAVQGVQDATLLRSLQSLLGRAVAEQMGGEEFTVESGRLFEQMGVTPLSDWHARLVWSNAVRTASHAAQWERTVGNPAAHRIFPYLRWTTLVDDEVRDRALHNHRVMAGFVAAIGHAIWRTWWPIAGHACRCYVAVITKGQAQRFGYTGAEPVGPWPTDPLTGQPAQPDPGFAGAPTFQQLAEDEEGRLTDFLDSANATGSADLRAALDLLIRALGLTGR